MKNLNKKIFYLFLGLLAITQLCDIHAMEMFPKETIKLQFSDQSDDEFTEVDKEFAMQFATIANMIEDAGEQDVLIPIQGVTSTIWNTIESLLSEIQIQDVKSIKNITTVHLKEVCVAFNYLDPKDKTRAKQIFDNAIQEYIERLMGKDQLTEDDFFDPGNDLNKILIDHFFQQIIKSNIVNPSKIVTSTPTPGEDSIFSPDGNILAIVQLVDSNTITLWDIVDNNTITLWDISDPKNPSEIVILTGYNPTFSPDGNILATVKLDDTIKLWDLSDPKNPSKIVTLTGNNPTFNPDGNILAIGQIDDTINLWDLFDPKNPSKIVTLIGNNPIFSPDGNILAIVQIDNNTIILWDISDPKNPSAIVTLTGYNPTFSPDDNILAVSQIGSKIIKLLDLSNPKNPLEIVTSTKIPGNFPTFNPDGNIITVVQRNGIIQIWNLSDPKNPSKIITSTKIYGYDSIFSPDGNIIAVTQSRGINLWSLYPPLLLDYLSDIQNNAQFIQSIIALFNMIKDPSQRMEENYNKFPDDIKEIIKILFPPQSI